MKIKSDDSGAQTEGVFEKDGKWFWRFDGKESGPFDTQEQAEEDLKSFSPSDIEGAAKRIKLIHKIKAYESYVDKEGDTIYKLPYDFKNLDELMKLAKQNEELLEFLRDMSVKDGVEGKNGEAWAGVDIIDYLRHIDSSIKAGELQSLRQQAKELEQILKKDNNFADRSKLERIYKKIEEIKNVKVKAEEGEGKFIKKGDVVIFDLEGFTKEDWGADSNKEWKQIESHDGKFATVTGIAVADVDENDPDYVDVKFEDGFEIEGLSVFHLTKKTEASMPKFNTGDKVKLVKGDYANNEGTVIRYYHDMILVDIPNYKGTGKHKEIACQEETLVKASIKAEDEVIDEQLEKGTKVETEHKGMVKKLKEYFEKNKSLPPDNSIYNWIAQDHINEFEMYYGPEFEEFENKLKEKKDSATSVEEVNEMVANLLRCNEIKATLKSLDMNRIQAITEAISTDLKIGESYSEDFLLDMGFSFGHETQNKINIWEPDGDGWMAERLPNGEFKVIRQSYEGTEEKKNMMKRVYSKSKIKAYGPTDPKVVDDIERRALRLAYRFKAEIKEVMRRYKNPTGEYDKAVKIITQVLHER